MTRLIYIQHPSVIVDQTTVPSNWGLSQKGREEVQKLLELDFWPDVDVVFTSTEPKTVTIGEMITEKFGLSTTAHSELGEADRTKTPFLPLDEYMQAVQEAYAVPNKRIRGWESHHEMFERNRKIIDRILRDNKGKTIAIIGHGGAGTCVKCYICNLPLSFSQDPKKTGCIFVADADARRLLQDWQSYC